MSSLRGYLIFLACYFLYAILLLPVVIVVSGSAHPQPAEETVFVPRPKDRPVIESVNKVWDARMTGVVEFDFDGEHYVITNLPKHYIDYSAWYVRMP